MRILLVHNYYGSGAPSGENRAFELEKELLEKNGHVVRVFSRYSDDIRKNGSFGVVTAALATPWNPAVARRLRAAIADFRPDVLHAHNTFPMISPAVFPAAHGAARVLTLHNYRLLCPAAIPMRDGIVCTDCIDRRSALPSMLHGCYRGSRAATLPLALNVTLNRFRGTWQHDIEAFVALSEFQREVMSRGGLPAERIEVKPNFYPGTPRRIPFSDRPERVVFAGRISPEKGIDTLVNAWIGWGQSAPELRILGDGPLLPELKVRAAKAANILFLGALDSDAAEAEIARARLVLLPSRWFEGFPMVLREAFAFGTPIGVSDIGPLPGIAAQADGIVFPPGDVALLQSAVSKIWEQPARLAAMGAASAAAFEANYSETVNYEALMKIYSRAVHRAKQTQK